MLVRIQTSQVQRARAVWCERLSGGRQYARRLPIGALLSRLRAIEMYSQVNRLEHQRGSERLSLWLYSKARSNLYKKANKPPRTRQPHRLANRVRNRRTLRERCRVSSSDRQFICLAIHERIPQRSTPRFASKLQDQVDHGKS